MRFENNQYLLCKYTWAIIHYHPNLSRVVDINRIIWFNQILLILIVYKNKKIVNSRFNSQRFNLENNDRQHECYEQNCGTYT